MGTPVLFVHHRSEASGAARSLAQLLVHLDERWEPHVLTPAGPAADAFAAVGATVRIGPPAAVFTHTWDVQYRGARHLLLVRELARLPGHLRALDRLLHTHRFALVHLNDSVLLPAAWLAHRRGVPVVVHLRSSLAADGRDRPGRAVVRALDRWADVAIAIDRDVARSFPLSIPIEVVHNPVSVSDSPRLELPVPEGRVRIGLLGYLRRQKGWPELLEAIALLAGEGLPVHLVVVGGDVRDAAFYRSARGRLATRLGVASDEETALRERAAELGVTDRLTILPYTLDPGPAIAALDVLAFPNQGAGLGRPVLEAASHGVPVVASGSPGGAGILAHRDTGLLVETPTPARLAAALRELVTSEELRQRLGAAAAASIERPGAAAVAVSALYDSLLGAARLER